MKKKLVQAAVLLRQAFAYLFYLDTYRCSEFLTTSYATEQCFDEWIPALFASHALQACAQGSKHTWMCRRAMQYTFVLSFMQFR